MHAQHTKPAAVLSWRSVVYLYIYLFELKLFKKEENLKSVGGGVGWNGLVFGMSNSNQCQLSCRILFPSGSAAGERQLPPWYGRKSPFIHSGLWGWILLFFR